MGERFVSQEIEQSAKTTKVPKGMLTLLKKENDVMFFATNGLNVHRKEPKE